MLLAGAPAPGVLLAPGGLYGRDSAVVAVFVGQDAASLVVGLPILLATTWLARRGSLVGRPLWSSALFFLPIQTTATIATTIVVSATTITTVPQTRSPSA